MLISIPLIAWLNVTLGYFFLNSVGSRALFLNSTIANSLRKQFPKMVIVGPEMQMAMKF